MVFSAALAIGSLTTSGEELIDALFGGGGAPPWPKWSSYFSRRSGVIAFVIAERNRLVMMIVSPDLARTAGVNVRRVDLAVSAALRAHDRYRATVSGRAIDGRADIIPAVTAKGVARDLRQMLALSVILAVAATVFGGDGLIGAVGTGPVIVLVAAACFS